MFVFDDMGYSFEQSEIMAAYCRAPEWVRTRGASDDGLVQIDMLPEFNARRPRNKAMEFLVERNVATRMVWTGKILRQPGIAHRQPAGMAHRQPAGIAHRQPAGIGHRQPAGIGHRQPAGIAHRQPADGLPNREQVMDRALSLPPHHGLTSDHVGHLVESTNDWLASL